MPSTSMAASVNSHYTISNCFPHPHLTERRNPNILRFLHKTKPICSSSSSSSSSPPPSSSVQTTHHGIEEKRSQQEVPFDSFLLFHQFGSLIDAGGIAKENPQAEIENLREVGFQSTKGEAKELEVISSNMWWAELKAAAGQRINVGGIVSFASVLLRDRHLALPHVAVPDIRYIDWDELKRRGFKGVVFDKDNTLTAPYSLALWPTLGSSFERCKAVFGHEIAVFSNSAGLAEYDHDGSKASALEGAIGIKVLRHRVKKPAGTAEEIEKHFDCAASQLIMVGDRPFTDIVYGNRNGFLTILTDPLSVSEEPFVVRQVRKLESSLLNHWSRRGVKPVRHNLLPDVTRCVKDPSIL